MIVFLLHNDNHNDIQNCMICTKYNPYKTCYKPQLLEPRKGFWVGLLMGVGGGGNPVKKCRGWLPVVQLLYIVLFQVLFSIVFFLFSSW